MSSPRVHQNEQDNDEDLTSGKSTVHSDPNRFFLHTKHILNRVEEAIFASPVLVRPNTQNFGHLYHFPPLAQPARLAGQGHAPGQGEQRAPSEVVASVLANARQPLVPPPLCEPSPPCRADFCERKPDLIQTGHNSWFEAVREFLTLREYTTLSRLNHKIRELTWEATPYWQKRFKLLCLGPHIGVPQFSNAVLHRWVKVLYLQQALAHHKRQLDLDLVIANQLEQPVRETTVYALTSKFRLRTHQCGLCSKDVCYSGHLDNNKKKVVDIIQMACTDCFKTKLWTPKQATVLWGIPQNKLNDDAACWRLSNNLWYTTQDLYEVWLQMDLSQRKLDPQLITKELADRYKDLPLLVQQTVQIDESQDNSLPLHPKVRQVFMLSYKKVDWQPFDKKQFRKAPGIQLLQKVSITDAASQLLQKVSITSVSTSVEDTKMDESKAEISGSPSKMQKVSVASFSICAPQSRPTRKDDHDDSHPEPGRSLARKNT